MDYTERDFRRQFEECEGDGRLVCRGTKRCTPADGAAVAGSVSGLEAVSVGPIYIWWSSIDQQNLGKLFWSNQ